MERVKTFTSIVVLIFLSISCPIYASGYFNLHNLMSQAQKNIPNYRIFNDSTLNLENQEKGSGHVVNTQFANNGGIAGCGISSTLMQYMYKSRGAVDLSSNYIALNVYSQINGFDPLAPFWGNPEGQVKGYLTQNGLPSNNVSYPYTPYHRVIPSIYPAYLGLFNNGLNCGRWVQANFDTKNCNDSTSSTGISKSCPTIAGLTYAGQTMQGYVFDSCEDNNGWCRDDAAHIDVNGGAITNNYYTQWSFITNPYYSNPSAPSYLKDIWLAWFSNATQYWSYVAILNQQNGISNMQYNIGNTSNPTWIDSHVLGGSNDITWSSTSNNGQLWQVEPVNSLTDASPSANPLYQMRMFDSLGYPAKNGTIYQFNLLFANGSLGQFVDNFYVFYQGGLAVPAGGTQKQNMILLAPPSGTGSITVSFNQLLPSIVSLDSTKKNYLRPVLISSTGYSWDPQQCTSTQCTYAGLPTNESYTLYAHAINDVSNDLTLTQTNDVSINSAAITLPVRAKAASYTLKASDINLSTQYSARITIPLQFAGATKTILSGNFQALFVPNATLNTPKNITATTQACFLNTYVNLPAGSNNSTCTVYYKVNNQTSIPATFIPSAAFNVILPSHIGSGSVNYKLNTAYNSPVQVTGYNPVGSPKPVSAMMPIASYQIGTGAARSFYLLIDPYSDTSCLQNLDPKTGVSVSLNGGSTITLTQPGQPLETQISQAITSLIAEVNLVSGAQTSCQAMPAIVPSTTVMLPGIDVIEVIKLVATPVSKTIPPSYGIAAIASGDANCIGATDTLLFSANGSVAASIPYTISATSTNLGVNVSPGTYSISDQVFNVPGGTCQLKSSPSVSIQTGTFKPVTLAYQFTETSGSNCSAAIQVSTWPNGCNISFTLASPSPLSNVALSWPAGSYNWSIPQLWEGTLSAASGNEIWSLPSWVDGRGSLVGMTVNGDGSPSICSGFQGSIPVKCSGTIKTN